MTDPAIIEAAERVAMLEQQVRLLALALLEVNEKAARTWEYDGEQGCSSGLYLDKERDLRAIAEGTLKP